MEIIIRPEKPDDFSAIYELNREAFGQENESILVELLRKSENYIPELSLVAVHDEDIAGHIMFSKIKVIEENGTENDSLSLAPMAVKTDLQKKGIGGKLVRRGLDDAKKMGFRSVIVLGHANYYPKFGFEKASRWDIKCPFKVPDEAFMAIELVPDALEKVKGTVRFPKEFEGV